MLSKKGAWGKLGQLSTGEHLCVEDFHHLQEISNSIYDTIFYLDQEVP